jgi:hypothetical protein
MNATGKLLVAALAAAGMAMAGDALADRGGGGRPSGGGGHWSGGGGGHWSGGTHRGGSYSGRWSGGGYRGGHWGGSHWGHRGGWGGARFGFYFGVPVVLGLGYWGSPYWGSSYWGYPYDTVVYREVIREPEVVGPVPEPVPVEPASSAQPAPSGGPLYMNYCESAREYYPQVSRCPEGWKFVTPTS